MVKTLVFETPFSFVRWLTREGKQYSDLRFSLKSLTPLEMELIGTEHTTFQLVSRSELLLMIPVEIGEELARFWPQAAQGEYVSTRTLRSIRNSLTHRINPLLTKH